VNLQYKPPFTYLPIYPFTHLQIQKAPSGFYEVYSVRFAVFSKELMPILVLWAQNWLCKYSARTLKVLMVFHDVWSWFGCRPDGLRERAMGNKYSGQTHFIFSFLSRLITGA
jgi:hypothetical protein